MTDNFNENEKPNLEEDNILQEEETTTSSQEEQIDWKDKYLRLLAESENIKKRAEKAKQDATLYSITKFAKEMLSVQDALNKALETIAQMEISNELKPFIEGIQLTQQQILHSFEKFDIKEINPLNEKFDANFHEILFQVEDQKKEDMTITEVFETGYVIKDRLLRAAKVVVARK